MLVEIGLLKGSWLGVSDISDGTAVIGKKRKPQMEFPAFPSVPNVRLNNPLLLR